jgi:hypothetical protein
VPVPAQGLRGGRAGRRSDHNGTPAARVDGLAVQRPSADTALRHVRQRTLRHVRQHIRQPDGAVICCHGSVVNPHTPPTYSPHTPSGERFADGPAAGE